MKMVGFALRALAGTTTRRLAGKGPLLPSWTFGFEVLARVLKQSGDYTGTLDFVALRQYQAKLALTNGVKRKHTTTREVTLVAGVPCEWFIPDGASRAGKRVIHFHGGGFVGGSSLTHADFLANLAHAAELPILAVNYRLAPEHKYPAAHDDCLAVTRAQLSEGPVVLSGDSAGGALVLATLMTLRDNHEPMPERGVCLSPWIDMTRETGSMIENAKVDWAEPRDFIMWREAYVPAGQDPKAPQLSPLFADLSGLPPLAVEVGTAEMLIDQVRDLKAALERAGATLRYRELPDMIHNSYFLASQDEACMQNLEAVAAFIKGSA